MRATNVINIGSSRNERFAKKRTAKRASKKGRAGNVARRENPKSYPNIDKSAFRRGEYVGYADGVWNIKPLHSNHGSGWQARHRDDPEMPTLRGKTLADISKDLETIAARANERRYKVDKSERQGNPDAPGHIIVNNGDETLYWDGRDWTTRRAMAKRYTQTKADELAEKLARQFPYGGIDVIDPPAGRQKNPSWHQRKAGPLAPPKSWTIVTVSNSGDSRMTGFPTREAAEARLAEWKKAGRGENSYVIGPTSKRRGNPVERELAFMIVVRDGAGKLRYWNGKAFTTERKSAALYSEGAARKLATLAANQNKRNPVAVIREDATTAQVEKFVSAKVR